MIQERSPLIPSPAPPHAAPKARPFPIDSRYVAPILITLILVIGQRTYGVLESYPNTLLAIGCSIVTEIVLGLLVTRKIPHLASAYVSGISCGILIRSPLVWPFALCAVVSIVSKYVLRVKGRHLWNPSNFGISALLFLAPLTVASLTQQWGNTLTPMLVIWTLGSVILWRLKRLHICLSYVTAYVAFAGLRSLLPGHPFLSEIAPITGPVYQLFIFFMITDPKSTVSGFWPQCAVAVAVAGAECVLRLMGNVHAPYFALFLVGPVANLIEIGLKSRRATPPALPGAVATA